MGGGADGEGGERERAAASPGHTSFEMRRILNLRSFSKNPHNMLQNLLQFLDKFLEVFVPGHKWESKKLTIDGFLFALTFQGSK